MWFMSSNFTLQILTTRTMKKILLTAFCATMLIACSGTDEVDPADNEVSNTLHLSFKTPTWEEFINCEKLDLYGYTVNETTNSVSATSASTKESFYFAIPADSSAMVQPGNLKKYPIKEYADVTSPFEFSQKLPVSKGATTLLVSEETNDDQFYNEVVAITYDGHDQTYAFFKVKCRYQMQTYELGNETNTKPVSGTFHFRVRTSRN